jgi:hypothetical protein
MVRGLGARAFRRPLTDAEVAVYLGSETPIVAIAREEGTFHAAADIVIQALLQDPRFVYRIETGTPVRDGVVRLGAYELASRLSYLLWGSAPDEALLAHARAGDLDTEAGVRAVAAEMLETSIAVDRIARFHAMWLDYDRPLPSGALAPAMRAETDALVRRVVFEERSSWTSIFTYERTYVDEALAAHYGLEYPAGATGPTWVDYGGSGRRGLLSHGSFLSNGAKFGDTSPVERGLVVRDRMLCQHIPPPSPELGVNVDEPPGDPTACKEDRYRMQHATGGCAGCHSLMDPVGFGLENFDATGAYREHEPDRPECLISGVGDLAPLGEFEGPGELGALVAAEGDLERCFTQHVFSFAVGRPADETPDGADARTVDALWSRFRGTGLRLDQLLIELVASEAFRHRVLPPS